jgi:predicted phosphodiesterase
LIHAGDFTDSGTLKSADVFNQQLGFQPHKYKVVIAGNHDRVFQNRPQEAERTITNAFYLRDSEVVIEGLRIWGSPWQPWFYNWAFNLPRGSQIKAKWDLIPNGIDVLVTHGPSLGHGDTTMRGDKTGCVDLLDAIKRIQPKLHIFGHIHEGYGISVEGVTACINASTCDYNYQPINAPVVIEL